MFKKLVENLKSIKKDYGNILKNSSVMKIVIAGFISSLGSKISYFAMLRKVYELSNGKITDLGFLSIAQCIPYIIFGAFAGIVIDKFRRKWIMIFSDIMSAVITVSVIFINNLSLIYVISFLSAAVYVFRGPAEMAFTPNLVEKEDIPLLNSFTSMSNSIIMIVGSALGAAAVGFVGVNGSFVADGISFLMSAIIIATILIKEMHTENKSEAKGMEHLKEFKDGVSIMWKDQTLKLILLIDLYVTFAMAMQGPLIYIFIKQSLNMGSKAELAWGALLSSLGVGSVLGSFIIGVLVKRYKNKFKLFLNVLLFDSISFTLFLLNKYFPLSILIFAFLGVVGTAFSIIINSTIQSKVDDENRGKVFSVFGMLSNPIAILSVLIGTTAAEVISAKYVLLSVAALEAAIALGVRLTKTFRQYELELPSGNNESTEENKDNSIGI